MKILLALKKSILFVIIPLGLLQACTDSQYKEEYLVLDSSNFYLHYVDTTIVIKWTKTSVISVAKADSFYILPDYPALICLDTIMGVDTAGVSVNNAIIKKTTVDAKTGQIKLNNGTASFKPGKYDICIGVMTLNGMVRNRQKPVKLDLVP
jgi:hypothetical protein